MQDNKLEKLRKVFDLLREDTITPAQLNQFLKAMTDAVKQTKLSIAEENTKVSKHFSKQLEQSLKELEEGHVRLKTALEGTIEGHVKILTKQTQDALKNAVSILEDIKGIKGDPGEPGKPGEPGHIKELSPQEVRDSLELLQKDERLDVSAIKGAGLIHVSTTPPKDPELNQLWINPNETTTITR